MFQKKKMRQFNLLGRLLTLGINYTQDIDGLNIYDILEPCYHAPEIREPTTGNSRLPSSFRKLGETDRPLAVRKRIFGRAWPFRAPVRDGIVPSWPQLLNSNDVPCTVSCLNYQPSNDFLLHVLFWRLCLLMPECQCYILLHLKANKQAYCSLTN